MRYILDGFPDAPTNDPADYPTEGPNALAGLGARAVARVTDTLLVIAVAMLIQAPFVEEQADGDTVVDLPGWVLPVILALWIGYEAGMVAWRGQTVGKMLMRIRVAARNGGGNPAPYKAAVRISVVLAAGLVVGAVVGALPAAVALMYVSAFADKGRRGLPDRAADTVVVSTR